MAGRDLRNVTEEMAKDERLKEGNLAVGSVPSESGLTYEIRYSAFEIGEEQHAALEEVASREDLELTVLDGAATLRHRP